MVAMQVPMGDTSAQYQALKPEIDAAVAGVLSSGQYVLGEHGAALEAEMAQFCGVAHGVGLNSGTDALFLALMALGVRRGDEVITSAFTFFATAEVISNLGAIPVFVDIDPDTYNLDPHQVATRVTPRTAAILPVHLYGQAADMTTLNAVAERHGLPVVEDAAQAIGAKHAGRPAGGLGRLAAFSFYPTKNLGACGDAGMVVTDDGEMADRIRRLRHHGSGGRYHHDCLGVNSRLDEIQAAILRVKLRYLPDWTAKRRTHAAVYDQMLASAPVTRPCEAPGNLHVYHQYTIRSPQRDALEAALKREGVQSRVFYPVPLHRQEVYQTLNYPPGSLPESERAAREVLSLPVAPELSRSQIEYAAQQIRAFAP